MTTRPHRALRLTALIGLIGSLVGAAPAEVRMPTREFDAQGYHVRLDLSRQVLGIEVPEERGFGEQGAVEAPITPTLQFPERGGLVSGSMLAQKAKQFDDGLYAAVELAAQNGAGRFGGKAAMLQAVARGLAASGAIGEGDPRAILLAACRLGKVPVALPPAAAAGVQATESTFLANPLRSKPLGFYTWSPALADIFRQDRMLQSELKGRSGIEALARALHADPRARATYEAYGTLVSRLTNPLKSADLRGLLAQLDRGQVAAPDRGPAFFPPSRAHETDLVMKLYGNRPIPEGFSLVDEMVRRIRAGQLDLKPTASSGWYDHQTWALEPLVIPERMPEAAHLQADESYRKQLLELFKGVIALTRETHVKQLEFPAPGAAAPPEGGPVVIDVSPELSAEPLATFYLRRADSYRFIRTALEQTFGAEALRGLRRQSAAGPSALDLAAELAQMEVLFRAASATVGRQLGMNAAPAPAPAPALDFARWAAGASSDPDIGKDARMMVPVFFDRGRGKTKAWVFLGWSQRPVHVRFVRPPAAEVTKDRRRVDPARVELKFGDGHYSLAYPVTAEVYVGQLLDRDEFRRHCDRYKTRSAILENLR